MFFFAYSWHNSVEGYVDRLKFSRDNILTLSGDQEIQGSYTFVVDSEYGTQSLSAPRGFQVDGRFNGFNLEKTLETLVKA